jgi:2-amino-4-hydroxy-6-hydroxymethyldihydropteridine diphosphokinase
MGEKKENCQKGIDALNKISKETMPISQSHFYRTEPTDFMEQDWFVNVIVKITTDLSPHDLFLKLKEIEKQAGRKQSDIKFGPRILDMDIILYDDIVLNTEELVIPHARMHKRRFVLKPLCDISPDVVHPVLKKDIKNLLNLLDEANQEVVSYS